MLMAKTAEPLFFVDTTEYSKTNKKEVGTKS